MRRGSKGVGTTVSSLQWASRLPGGLVNQMQMAGHTSRAPEFRVRGLLRICMATKVPTAAASRTPLGPGVNRSGKMLDEEAG